MFHKFAYRNLLKTYNPNTQRLTTAYHELKSSYVSKKFVSVL